jgi:hypothetical protein
MISRPAWRIRECRQVTGFMPWKAGGQHSIPVNDRRRICFRFTDGDAYDVEITDYH